MGLNQTTHILRRKEMNNKITFGGLYQANENIKYIIPKYNDSLNDQKINLWIPVRATYFDRGFGIGFLDILKMISDEEAENRDYYIEKDTKNQNKTTIKIDTNICLKVIDKIEIPNHFSELREVGDRGRLLFNVNFESSKGTILKDNLNQLIGIDKDEV